MGHPVQVRLASDGSVTGRGSGRLRLRPPAVLARVLSTPTIFLAKRRVSSSVSRNRTNLAFKLQLTETKIDGATAGLINYALLVSLTNNPPVLTVPITTLADAEGETDVNVAVPNSDGGTVPLSTGLR